MLRIKPRKSILDLKNSGHLIKSFRNYILKKTELCCLNKELFFIYAYFFHLWKRTSLCVGDRSHKNLKHSFTIYSTCFNSVLFELILTVKNKSPNWTWPNSNRSGLRWKEPTHPDWQDSAQFWLNLTRLDSSSGHTLWPRCDALCVEQ